MPLLRLEGLTSHGVGPVDLSIEPGECVCLSGPSGAGKTLLLRAVADLDPHGGTALLDGRPASAMAAREWRRQVGLLAAESQWWGERVGEHFPPAEGIDWARLGFGPETAQWEVTRASTGERQRLALLRLLANSPSALLLDEPTASLDPENVTRAEDMVGDYVRERQAPVLWVSHDPAQIRRVADRHYRMEAGRLREEAL